MAVSDFLEQFCSKSDSSKFVSNLLIVWGEQGKHNLMTVWRKRALDISDSSLCRGSVEFCIHKMTMMSVLSSSEMELLMDSHQLIDSRNFPLANLSNVLPWWRRSCKEDSRSHLLNFRYNGRTETVTVIDPARRLTVYL